MRMRVWNSAQKGNIKKKLTVISRGAVATGLAVIITVCGATWIAAQAQKEPGPPHGPGPGQGRGMGMGMGKMPDREPLPVTDEEAKAPVEDGRIFVPMPPKQRGILREQMKQMLASLTQIQALLAAEKFEEAAELAETTMGRTERGKHRGEGPGLYMPVPMRALAWGMHDSASEFAETAGKGDLKASYIALQKVQATCVACHYSYRTY